MSSASSSFQRRAPRLKEKWGHEEMLLTISTTHRPATDLGYLLSKHPDRCQTFSLSYGQAHVFYPEAGEDRCTAALLLDFDPVGLVRGRRRGSVPITLAQYVNDRPYIASSFLSVAIGRVFSTAMRGQSRERPELAEASLPLRAEVSTVPCRGGEGFLRGLFEPLGYEVKANRLPLDETFPEWGESAYFSVVLKGRVRLSELLNHLYVLLPMLDNQKHYWVDRDEVEKLLRRGGQWLKNHPLQEAITKRYLRFQRSLFREALERLLADEGPDPSEKEVLNAKRENELEETLSLNDQRIGAVVAVVKEAGARRILDLGCGEGRLIGMLLADPAIPQIRGMDVSMRSLDLAKRRLRLDRMPEKKRQRVELFQSSLTYRDNRLKDCDAACAVEVIEHIDPGRMNAFERTLFEFAEAPLVIVTTPNREYNVRFEGLPAGKLRHRDHRFEWTRREFHGWSRRVAEQYGYEVRFLPIGPEDTEVGSPTQMGVFKR